jgi:hypothetical protein
MTDEKYTFIEDVRDKKKTATGAYHKRTHCGKGGAVRFPSDFMTKKELRAMNGEVKEYRLNDPMRWKEFKAMPDDIKVLYIKSLRKAYNVSDTKITEMLGVSVYTLCKEMKRLGISAGQRSGRRKWDEDGWYAWLNGAPVEAKGDFVTFTQGKCFEFKVDDVAAEEIEAVSEKRDEEVLKPTEKCDAPENHSEKCGQTVERIIPCRGSMTLKGDAEAVLETVKRVISGANMTVTVYWCTDEAAGVVCDG